jgi:enoyl-[acyl-carrier-protein] reductase (NADH)
MSLIEEALKKMQECLELNEPFESYSPDIVTDLGLVRNHVEQIKANPTKEVLAKAIGDFQRMEKQYAQYKPFAPDAIDSVTWTREALEKAMQEAK